MPLVKVNVNTKRIDMAEVYERVSKRTRVSPATCKKIIEHLVKSIRSYMELPSVPEIVITGIFKFRPNIDYIRKRVNFAKYSYEVNQVGESYYKYIVNMYQEVLNRYSRRKSKLKDKNGKRKESNA